MKYYTAVNVTLFFKFTMHFWLLCICQTTQQLWIRKLNVLGYIKQNSMSLKRKKLLHIGKSFLFLREGEQLARSSLSLTINWKAEKETVISVVKDMYAQEPFRSTGRAMWWCSVVVVRAFGPLSILPAVYANYQAFFSYLWVSSLMICLYQLKPYSPGTLTHSTAWSAHMLLSSKLANINAYASTVHC